MSSLSQEDVDEITHLPHAAELIIACGIHPKDGSLMIVNANAQVFSITPNGKMKPTTAQPIHKGEHIKIIFCKPYGLHIIDSKIAIMNAKIETSKMQLNVNGTELCTLSSEH